MAAHFKVTDEDKGFLSTPSGASLLFSGSKGTQTWIERTEDSIVRIGIQSVGVATADGRSLAVCIDVAEASAKGEDGPAPIETHLNASQSVQLLVKAGERVSLKAYPSGQDVQVLRTVVWALDLDTRPRVKAISERSVRENDAAGPPAAISH
ncbi:MAG TPA: hypothetical protein VHX64_09430 [Caulobacteraceae bacterium]|nr:hypothetical protein [Caulobacteraceae bacterium]